MTMACRVWVAGSSHIKRLHRFSFTSPRWNVDPELHLEGNAFQISWQGKSGATFDSFVNNDGVLMSFLQTAPHIVILQLGSNDLCNQSVDPVILVSDLIEFGKHLCSRYQVSRVYLCQLFRRKEGHCTDRFVSDLEWYNHRLSVFNETLRTELLDNPKVKYWKHIGLINDVESYLSVDGCHLSDSGLYKHFRSIRGAVIDAADHF